MLAFKNRFHGRGIVRAVLRTGLAVRTDALTYKYRRSPHRRHPRIAVVVSKKIQKSAVGRNRIRRRLYEEFRQRLDQLEPSSDIVVIVTSGGIVHMSSQELHRLVDDSLIQTGLYKTP